MNEKRPINLKIPLLY